MKIITPAQLQNFLAQQKTTLLDIRAKADFENSNINSAIHLNLQQIEDFYPTCDKSQPTIIYCYHGVSSQRAATLFEELGFADVYSLQGGFSEWSEFISTNDG